MSVKIRLKRMGKRNRPIYRVIATNDATAAQGGNVLEILGIYDPLTEPSSFEVDKEKVLSWLKKGALPSFKVRKLLGKCGILEPVDVSKLKKKPRKSKKKGEGQGKEEVKREEK